jgi:hypothetical protein
MDSLGIMVHLLLSEAENSNIFEYEEYKAVSEGFARARKLFYREMVARIAHHPALTWNLGEENNMPSGHGEENANMASPNSDEQRKLFARYIRTLDPYDHMIVVHNSSWDIYPPLYGFDAIEGPSMQVHEPEQCYDKTIQYRRESAASGKKWVVCVDEIGHYSRGAVPDSVDPDHDRLRKDVLWANLMAGGAGVEWYFGYKYADNDLDCEDWRSRDILWNQTRIAIKFFERLNHLSRFEPANHLLSNSESWCLAVPGEQYVIYLREGDTTKLEISDNTTYTIQWYNPRMGGKLFSSKVLRITGPGVMAIGLPPMEQNKDWAVLVSKI